MYREKIGSEGRGRRTGMPIVTGIPIGASALRIRLDGARISARGRSRCIIQRGHVTRA